MCLFGCHGCIQNALFDCSLIKEMLSGSNMFYFHPFDWGDDETSDSYFSETVVSTTSSVK